MGNSLDNKLMMNLKMDYYNLKYMNEVLAVSVEAFLGSRLYVENYVYLRESDRLWGYTQTISK